MKRTLITVGIVVTAALVFIGWSGTPPFHKPSQPYEACVKCNHFFTKGTGKTIPIFNADEKKMLEWAHCPEHAPEFDRILSGMWSVESVTKSDWWTFQKAQSPWRAVNKDGSEINPHKCPETIIWMTVPVECMREHVEPDSKVWGYFTNPWHTNTIILGTNGLNANAKGVWPNDGYFTK